MRPYPLVALFTALLITAACNGRADTPAADALYKAGKWAEAREAYLEALPRVADTDRARVHINIGYTFERRGKNDDAIAEYRKALAIESVTGAQRAVALMRIGGRLNNERRFEEACRVLTEAIQTPDAHPNMVIESYLLLSTCHRKLENDDLALADLAQVRRVEGATGYYYATALKRIGAIHQSRGDLDQALIAFRGVLNTNGATRRQKAWAENYIAELEALKVGDTPFYIKPYALWIGPDAAKVIWVSLGEVPPGRVTAVADQSLPAAEATSTVSPIRTTSCQRHVAVLSGLTTGVGYGYTVSCGGEEHQGSFRSAPVAGQPVTFAVLGDTQAAPDLHAWVGAAIHRDQPDFVIHVGDLTDHGATWGKWRTEFFDPGLTYMRDSFIAPTVGNHDGGHFYPTLFDQSGRLYYSFDYGDVHVTVLDSYWSGGRNRPTQLKWLEADLAATKATWKIVSTHVPMVSTSADQGCEWFGMNDYLPILEKYGVDVVVCGHQPMYSRYLPIGRPGAKPVLHITSGGGGPVGAPVPGPLLVKGADKCHHSFFRIQGNRLDLVAKLPDGAEIDTLTLIKTNGCYQPDIMAAAVDPGLAHSVRSLYQELLTDRGLALLADFSTRPRAGEEVTLSIDTAALPRGGLKRDELPPNTSLVIGQSAGSSWTVPTQDVPLDRAQLCFNVTPPAGVTVGAGTLNPELQIVMRLKVGNRVFEPHTTPVRPTPASAARLAAGAGGLPTEWWFRLDPEGCGDAERWPTVEMAPGKWRRLSVTAWWENQLEGDYDGVAWYRAQAAAPTIEAGNRLWLELGAVDESCWAYVNGTQVGAQVYDSKADDGAWEKPRRFDITDTVRPGTNTFAIKVRDLFGMGGIYRGAVLRQARANLYPAGGFSGGTSGWTVVAADTGEAHSVAVSADNGKYVDETSLRVETRAENAVTLGRVCEATLAPGAYALSLRFRQRLLPTARDAYHPVRLRVLGVGNTDELPPLAELRSAAAPSSDWETLSGVLNVPEAPESAPMHIEIRLDRPGIYHFDEIRIVKSD